MLFSQTVGDSLPHDHDVRAFSTLMDSLDLKSFYAHYSKEGGTPIDPRIMVSILFFGFTRRVRSSRQLERMTIENNAMRYLIGGTEVNFRTIAKFRVKFGPEINKLLAQSVRIVRKYKPEVGCDVKVDGTKIKADASDAQTYTKEELEKQQKAIEAEVGEYLKGADDTDHKEDKIYGKNNSGIKIDSETIDKIVRDLKEIQGKGREAERNQKPPDKDGKVTQNEQSALVEKGRNAGRMLRRIFRLIKIYKFSRFIEKMKSTDKLNLTDPHAKFMKRNGLISMSYNVQLASSQGFIVSAAVALANSPNDLQQLPAVLKATEKNTGMKPDLCTTDAGYFDARSLAYMHQNDINGFTPSPQAVARERKGEEETGFEKHYFHRNAEKGELVCPQAKILKHTKSVFEDNQPTLRYFARPIDCVICNAKEECLTNKENQQRGRKSIEIPESHEIQQQMIKKMKEPSAIAYYRKRGAEVEPQFGNWKHNYQCRNFLLRGKKKIACEITIAAVATNFAKLIRQNLLPAAP